MRKLIAAALFSAMVLNVSAQNMDRNDITYEYIQLPQQPLNKVYKNYQATVVVEYENKVAQQKAEYQQQVAKAEQEYQAAYNLYLEKEKAAEDQYQKDLADYNSKSTSKKVLEQSLLNNQKPVKQVVTPPTKQVPVEPNYPKVYNAQTLASGYIKLDGYQNLSANAIKITVYLNGFEMLEPQQKEEMVNVKNSAGATVQEKRYYYTIEYRHTMRVVVETPLEGIVYEETPASTTEFFSAKVGSYANVYELRNYWANNKTTLTDQYEDKAAFDNLKKVNQHLNDKFGFSKRSRESTVISINDKAGAYADYNQAYGFAAAGYKNLYQSIDKAVAKEHFRKAIVIWEKGAAEADFNNKKARVGAELAINTMLMLCEAYIWTDDYANAQTQLDKMISLDLNKKQRRYYEMLEIMKKDQEARYVSYTR